MECIRDLLSANNWTIAQSPGDGHCLIYSTITSWNSQQCDHNPINKSWLLDEIRNEFNDNRYRYSGFLAHLSQDEIHRQLTLYLEHKRYNLAIVDVIPSVICNVLNVSLKIISEQHNAECDIIDILPESAAINGNLSVHKFGDHYNGLACISVIQPTNQRIIYTRDQLNHLNTSNLRVARTLRKALIKQHIWKPTGSTRPKPWGNAKFALVNAQSVRNRSALLLSDYIASNDLDIICITETWLTQLDSVDVAVLEGENYTLSHVVRETGRGGGVGILFKSSYKLVRSSPIKSKGFEGLNITLKHPSRIQLTVVVIYRPPSAPTQQFFESFNTVLQELSVHGNNVIICGDFNIHYNNARCNVARELMGLLDQCGYKQSVNVPTHARGNTLDLIITPTSSDISSQPRTTTLFSDHYILECNVNLRKVRPPTKCITYRKFRCIDSDSFSNDLTSKLDCCDTVPDFNANVLSVLDIHAPLTSRKVTDRIHQPWHNPEITAAKRNLRERERMGCAELSKCKNSYSALLHVTKCQYYRKTITESKDDIKSLFKITDLLLGKKHKTVLPSCDSDDKLSEDFSKYFASKVEKIHSEINVTPPAKVTLSTCTDPAFAYLTKFPIVTTSDTITLIKGLKPKVCLLDPLPAFMFKDYASQLAPAVCTIINTSLSTAVVPKELKVSIITPIYKRKQLPVDQLSSYRPIAQMPFVAKLLERHVSQHLRLYMENNAINDVFQSAYRPNHSTETAVVKIFSDICLSLGVRRQVILCLLDLSSAFDTLKHSILIQRLSDVGIRGTALEWFRSYLTDRSASIKVNNHVCKPTDVQYGVPQGSVLGPALFNIYCLPIGNIIRNHNISYHIYADDSQLYLDFSNSDEKVVVERLQACVSELKSWLSDNFLLLNDRKTEIVRFGKDYCAEEYKIGGATIESKSCVTSLGCTLDSGLTMASHASRISKSANYYLYCIRKIRNCLTLDMCKLLVHTLVIARLDYGNALLYGATDDVLRQLERVQRQAARVVCKKITNDHSSVTELLWGLHWLPIRARIQYKVLLLAYKAVTSNSPPYLADMLTTKSNIQPTRSAKKVNILDIPRIGKNGHSDRAFAHAAPHLWNTMLTDDMRGCRNIDSFKKKLKTLLFTKHY